MKKTISVLLCCILLAAFAPAAFAADTLIGEAYATYAVPVEGEAFDFSAITVPIGAHYTAKIVKVYYQNNGKWQDLADGETVIGGVSYVVRIHFSAEKGYRLDNDKTVYTINGEHDGSFVGANLVEVSFVAEKSAVSPEEPTGANPTFRERVKTFLRDMRNRFVFIILWVRSLFGIK